MANNYPQGNNKYLSDYISSLNNKYNNPDSGMYDNANIDVGGQQLPITAMQYKYLKARLPGITDQRIFQYYQDKGMIGQNKQFQQPQEQQNTQTPGFFGKIGQDFAQGFRDVHTSMEQGLNSKNLLSGATRALAGGAGGISRSFMALARPITAPLSGLTSFLMSPFTNQISKNLSRPEDQQAISQISQKVNDWTQQHPEAAANLKDIFDTAGVIGMAYGAGKAVSPLKDLFQGVKGGFKGATGGIKSFVKGKTEQQILSTAEKDVYKLNPVERGIWFDNQKSIINSNTASEMDKLNAQTAIDRANIEVSHGTAKQQIESDLKKSIETTTKNAEDLQKQLSTASRDKVIELRPKIIKAMAEQSSVYRNIVDKEMAGRENIPIKISELKNYIDSQYADNPQLGAVIKEKLGLDTALNPNSKAPFKTSLRELYNKVKSLKKDISAGASRGTKVFNSDDINTDKAINALTGFMKNKGVNFSEANKFWAKYAPIRNQLVSEAKPFLQTGTQTKTFANTLMRVAQEKDVNNENFINEVENLLGEPINKDNKAIIVKMTENQKTALAKEAEYQQKMIENDLLKKDNMESLKIDTKLKEGKITEQEAIAKKELNSKMIETERKSKIRKWIKRALFVGGGFGSEKTFKKYTGVGF